MSTSGRASPASTRWAMSLARRPSPRPAASRAGLPPATCSVVEARSIPELYAFGIYAIPEIAWAGSHETLLTKQAIPYETGVARYKEIARGQILGDLNGMLKLIFHLDTRKLLGVWALGTQATELVHIGQAVMGLGGRRTTRRGSDRAHRRVRPRALRSA
jgi:pyruvate/2-oxoglutarate dehydrogenase complex dihydrolipoamide dehydrogenase (E3) component